MSTSAWIVNSSPDHEHGATGREHGASARRAGQSRGGHSGTSSGGQARRRGEELENAILDAAWDVLVKVGYADMTFDAVAAQAGTSRTVITRRWPTRQQLTEAAVGRRVRGRRQRPIPDTGNLRDDLIQVVAEGMSTYDDVAVVVSLQLASYFQEKRSTPGQLRDDILRQQGSVYMPTILLRAQQRGEINLTGVPQRVLDLPVDLVYGQMLKNASLPSLDEVTEIIDTIFFPLLRAYGALTADPIGKAGDSSQ